jgi:predicted DNA-binding transcriptional regulator AlpA
VKKRPLTLASLEMRLVAKDRAAALYDMDESTFDKAVAAGKIPPAIRFGDRCLRWDLHLLHRHADQLSGIVRDDPPEAANDVRERIKRAIRGSV